MKKEIAKVSDSEKDEIQQLFERRNGLDELAKIVTADNNELYEKVVIDLGKTNVKFQQWWDNIGKKYNLENRENCHWSIDFESCIIYLED